METRSMPTPTMLMPGTLAEPSRDSADASCRASRPIPTVLAETRLGIEQHVGFLTLLGGVAVEAAIGRLLVHGRPTRDRRGQPPLTLQHTTIGATPVVLALLGI